MNNRIEELAKEAGFSKDKYSLYWDDDANAEGVDLEKFAELVINECADVANSVYSLRVPSGPIIKKHFGYKE